MDFETITQLTNEYLTLSNDLPERKKAVKDAWLDAFFTLYVEAHNAELEEQDR